MSYIEIYNDEVRDLLVTKESGDNTSLDSHRGIFLDANEMVATSYDSLLDVLFAGEKNRQVANTGMNERSSRSHTIFRITVESRGQSGKCKDEDNDNDELLNMKTNDDNEKRG